MGQQRELPLRQCLRQCLHNFHISIEKLKKSKYKNRAFRYNVIPRGTRVYLATLIYNNTLLFLHVTVNLLYSQR